MMSPEVSPFLFSGDLTTDGDFGMLTLALHHCGRTVRKPERQHSPDLITLAAWLWPVLTRVRKSGRKSVRGHIGKRCGRSGKENENAA
jgi:hypothetical protein